MLLSPVSIDKRKRIGLLNDVARTAPWSIGAEWRYSDGVNALIGAKNTSARAAAIRAAVMNHSDFPAVAGLPIERDFGTFEVLGTVLCWSIEYLEPGKRGRAAAPWRRNTTRLVTVQLGHEF